MDYLIFWNGAIEELKKTLSPFEIHMWFQNMRYQESNMDKQEIYIHVPSPFYAEHVSKYKSMIEKKIIELSGHKLKIVFIYNKIANEEKNVKTEPEKKSAKTITKKANTNVIKRQNPPNQTLVSDFNFDNYVIGDSNEFAAHASLAVAEKPGKIYNPLLIYGGSGLGKTHLIMAIGNRIHTSFYGKKVLYVSCESFTNEFISSIQNNTTHSFRLKYRDCDILLIDDIHFLEKKDSTQEELFHTFNDLSHHKKQMVFTSDRQIKELKNIQERLRNRFEYGLVADLQPPKYETRVAIFKKMIINYRLQVTDEAIEYICTNITSNIRELAGAVKQLLAYTSLMKINEITIDTAKNTIKNLASIARIVSIDTIMQVTADFFNIRDKDLKSKKKSRSISFPRQVAMYLGNKITDLSTTEIGNEFGGKDHSTVIFSVKKIEAKMKEDTSFNATINHLREQIIKISK